jgi:hypothetical protein
VSANRAFILPKRGRGLWEIMEKHKRKISEKKFEEGEASI